jgi:hypothetical protein
MEVIMKSIILFLVSIVFLYGCREINSPYSVRESGGWFNFKAIDSVVYSGRVMVMFDNGEPCTISDLHVVSNYIYWHADSMGIIDYKYSHPIYREDQIVPDSLEIQVYICPDRKKTRVERMHHTTVWLGEEWTGEYTPLLVIFDENIEHCYDEYRASLSVHYESGKPCIKAWAYIEENTNVWSGSEADSNGIIRLSYSIDYDENNPDIKIFPCYVYIDATILPEPSTLEDAIWYGDVGMFNVSIPFAPEDFWPDPFIEVVIPDSLAP